MSEKFELERKRIRMRETNHKRTRHKHFQTKNDVVFLLHPTIMVPEMSEVRARAMGSKIQLRLSFATSETLNLMKLALMSVWEE